ncbi:Hsp20/alpha crystallin family protein [Paraflavitalea sp. CAU 1676]|uniref:Hsp20/alpha crystallin family protein n=1 Tax=Paraflavitalea sp. CAU 1676 TaxID=3032598 RepID=UPI0023DB592D|nr:Hsp20/alpha crystallin family protein [Paraflavitalea sp. CAU 1676]MDF2187754.1 Hsp20/alpha crystallin family protein [Paraflavitalea sp. CAU 1676]
MTLVKFNNRPANRVFNSVFDDLFNQIPATWKDSALHNPPVNIHETPDAYHVELSAAGLSKEDFQVKVEEGLLTISFEKKEETKNEEYKTVRREFVQRSFKRSFSVDENIDVENIQAKYDQGVLKLHLPKKEQPKASVKQINIQ